MPDIQIPTQYEIGQYVRYDRGIAGLGTGEGTITNIRRIEACSDGCGGWDITYTVTSAAGVDHAVGEEDILHG